MIRLLVTGWRNATGPNYGAQVADAMRLAVAVARLARGEYVAPRLSEGPGRGVVLVHGACAGVDTIAHVHARRWEWDIEPHPAVDHPTQDFGRWPEAGPRRNLHMVSLGADIVLGLPGPGSRGTVQCVGMAMKYGLRTLVIPLDHRAPDAPPLDPAADRRRGRVYAA